jgi:hypothetical protein
VQTARTWVRHCKMNESKDGMLQNARLSRGCDCSCADKGELKVARDWAPHSGGAPQPRAAASVEVSVCNPPRSKLKLSQLREGYALNPAKDETDKKTARRKARGQGFRPGKRGYFLGICASMSVRRFCSEFISLTRRSSSFLRSLLLTMLRLAASRTTLAGRVRSRVIRDWSLKLLR